MELKIIYILIIGFFAQISLAGSMDRAEQDQKVEEIAKELREKFWNTGHKEVDSYIEKMNSTLLGVRVNLKANESYEHPLSEENIAKLYDCIKQQYCELYAIDVSATMYGNYGASTHYTLLDSKSGKHFSISHITYLE